MASSGQKAILEEEEGKKGDGDISSRLSDIRDSFMSAFVPFVKMQNKTTNIIKRKRGLNRNQ